MFDEDTRFSYPVLPEFEATLDSLQARIPPDWLDDETECTHGEAAQVYKFWVDVYKLLRTFLPYGEGDQGRMYESSELAFQYETMSFIKLSYEWEADEFLIVFYEERETEMALEQALYRYSVRASGSTACECFFQRTEGSYKEIVDSGRYNNNLELNVPKQAMPLQRKLLHTTMSYAPSLIFEQLDEIDERPYYAILEGRLYPDLDTDEE